MTCAMTCMACVVSVTKFGWSVHSEGMMQRGPYFWQDVALRVALAEAMTLRRAGNRARISVRSAADGDASVEYCLCSDFKISGAVS